MSRAHALRCGREGSMLGMACRLFFGIDPYPRVACLLDLDHQQLRGTEPTGT